MITKVPEGFLALENRGGDIEERTYHTREQAEHELLWNFSRRLNELEEKISAAADLWVIYEQGDFGDGDRHRDYMRRLLRECSEIAIRLHHDDPAWSLLGDCDGRSSWANVIAEDGTVLKGYDDADEWLRLKSMRLLHEDMKRKREAKAAADAADPERQKRVTESHRTFLRTAMEITPPEILADELKRASKRTRRARTAKKTTSKRRAQ